MAEEVKNQNTTNPADEIDQLVAEIQGNKSEEPTEEQPAEEVSEENATVNPADEIDQLLAEVQGGNENNQQIEETKAEEAQETSQEESSPADEIDQLLAEIQCSKEEEGETSEEPCDAVDDIDALIEAYQKEQETGVEGTSQEESEDSGSGGEDIVDQILAELESGKMGAAGATNEAGAYEVPTAKKLLEREDVSDIIQKLEERLASLSEEDESIKVELIALIETLKKQLEAQRKEKEETRVIAKLYKVTRETEEKTVELMEIIEKAMDIAGECLTIVEEVKDEEVKNKLTEKLNGINEVLFEAINHLQFQDITRQKIERIIAALKKLNDYLNEWFGTDFIGD